MRKVPVSFRDEVTQRFQFLVDQPRFRAAGSLDESATWVRRLLPVLQGPEAADTIRKATRYEKDKNGNPTKRPRGITWKYP